MADGLITGTRDALLPPGEEWTRLWGASGATPFQSSEWLLPWWDAFGAGEPLVIQVREEGRLVGLAPLYVCDGTVRLIGCGNTDYLDIIVRNSALPNCGAVADAVLDCLAQNRARWRICDLLDVPASSALLAAAAPAGFAVERREYETCPVLRLPEDADALDATAAPRLRKSFRQYKRRCGERFRFETAGPERVSEFVDALLELHEARRRATGENGIFQNANMRRFFRCASEGLARSGLLRLHGLRDEHGRLRAVQYCLARGERIFAYIAGYDPQEDFSPGTVLLRLTMEQAIRDGFREFDFLRGREPYKYDWGARDETTWRVRLIPA